MVNALRYFGVDQRDAEQFVASIAELLRTFIEVYGRGGIVDETCKQRRNLNAEGLDAFYFRTTGPDGQYWDFSRRQAFAPIDQ